MSQPHFNDIVAIMKNDFSHDKMNFRDPLNAKDRLAGCLNDYFYV